MQNGSISIAKRSPKIETGMVDASMVASTTRNWKGNKEKNKSRDPYIPIPTTEALAHTIQRDLLSALITTFEVRNTTLEKHHNSGSSYAPISNVANTFNDTNMRTDGQVVLMKILSKNVHAVPGTIHTFFKTNMCCRTMAITVSCAMQWSAAIISEAQM